MHIMKTAAALAAVLGTAAAQRPANMSICDYYTTALLKNNTAANQLTVLTLVVNTAVIGNFSKINTGVTVPGILAPGEINGTKVNLLPYFAGALDSSNRGGSSGVAVNFLDGGGAAPLMNGMPANDQTSNQYFLLTHLYGFFGALLGCTQLGQSGFPPYNGQASMYEVHAFMDLNVYQVTYFITQVGLAAASFGVTAEDATAVGEALGQVFGVRCGAPYTVIPAQGAQLQSVCIDGSCPLAASGADCAAYGPALAPVNATTNMTATAPGSLGTATVPPVASGTTSMSGSMSMSGMSSSATSTPSSVSKAGAAATGLSLVALAGGFAALML